MRLRTVVDATSFGIHKSRCEWFQTNCAQTEPKFIAEIAFTEWTSDGSIRLPSFQGLREDKSPKVVIRE
jgi:ATP-dependent DNA ligase